MPGEETFLFSFVHSEFFRRPCADRLLSSKKAPPLLAPAAFESSFKRLSQELSAKRRKYFSTFHLKLLLRHIRQMPDT